MSDTRDITASHRHAGMAAATTCRLAVTFDTDWAPDWCIRLCFDLCREAGVGATFFVTNPSPVLEEIAADPRFELGIHPNFFANTTQILPDVPPVARDRIRAEEMTRIAAVMEYCLSVVPGARSMRTHGLWACSNMYGYIEEQCPTIRNTLSCFIPKCENVIFWRVRYSYTANRPLLHMSYAWEDDMACLNGDIKNGIDGLFAGNNCAKIVAFHPAHVALNTVHIEKYNHMKNIHLINTVSQEELTNFINTDVPGIYTCLQSILQRSHNYKTYTISDIAEYFTETVG